MIRRATSLDIPAIAGVLGWAYERSIYAGKVAIDRFEANRVLTNAIQRHGGKGVTGTWVTVAVKDHVVCGFIIGVLSPVYHIGDRCTASDLYWLSTDYASPMDSARLMLGFREWALAHPKVFDIVCGATGAMGDWEKAGGMLERMGLERHGAIYRQEKAA